jgi:hypothetical protein
MCARHLIKNICGNFSKNLLQPLKKIKKLKITTTLGKKKKKITPRNHVRKKIKKKKKKRDKRKKNFYNYLR